MNALLLTKVLAQLVLPPAGLVLLGLIGLVFWRRAWGRGLALLSWVLFAALATDPVKDALVRPLEFKYPPLPLALAERQKDAAIVLLGGGLYARAPEYGGADQLDKEAMAQTLYAAVLARRTGLPVYTSGGGALTAPTAAEGDLMRRWLIRLGVSRDRVHADTFARNTWENAVYVRRLLERAGIDTVILVTSAVHMPRAVFCFEKQGLKVIAAPCAYRIARLPRDLRSYLPHWRTLADSGDALHEYLGYLWYWLRYA